MPTDQIIQHLTKHGERLDSEIAHAVGIPLAVAHLHHGKQRRLQRAAVGIPLAVAHLHLRELTANGKVMSCHVTRFVEGIKTEGITCRLVEHIPKVALGKKTM